MQGQGYTPEEINEAYSKLIWARGLVDFVLRAGLQIDAEHEAEIEGSLISIFHILRDYLIPVEEVMDYLDMGSAGLFTAIWKKGGNEQ